MEDATPLVAAAGAARSQIGVAVVSASAYVGAAPRAHLRTSCRSSAPRMCLRGSGASKPAPARRRCSPVCCQQRADTAQSDRLDGQRRHPAPCAEDGRRWERCRDAAAALGAALCLSATAMWPGAAIAAAAATTTAPAPVLPPSTAPISKKLANRGADVSGQALLNETIHIVERYGFDVDNERVDKFLAGVKPSKLQETKSTYEVLRNVLRLSGDRFARLLTPTGFQSLSKFDFTGVGLLLSPDDSGHFVVGATPTPGSSAAQNNALRGDRLMAIDGRSVDGRSGFELNELLQGEDGSTVRVTLRTDGQPPRDLELTRHITTPSAVTYEHRTIGKRRVGYIRLREFNASCNLRVRDALSELEKVGVDTYVLDLRSNPGGIMEGAQEIAGLFMDRSKITARVMDKRGFTVEFPAKEVGKNVAVSASAPLLILTDRNSASAAEVLTGALRDNCRAVSVGKTTYGKGVIQGVFALPDGAAVVLTVAKYLTPAYHEIQDVGIVPDIPMRMPSRMQPARLQAIDYDRAEQLLKMCKADIVRES